MTSSDERTIELSRTKVLVISLGASIFVALGIWLWLLDDAAIQSSRRFHDPLFVHSVGIASVAFFGAALLFALRRLFDRKPALVFDSEGFIDNSSAAAAGRVPWSEVTGAHVMQIQRQKMLIVEVRHPETYVERGGLMRRAMNRANYRLCGSPIAISSNSLRIGFSELCALFDAYRQKYCTP
jgi:hypothetical protein